MTNICKEKSRLARTTEKLIFFFSVFLPFWASSLKFLGANTINFAKKSLEFLRTTEKFYFSVFLPSGSLAGKNQGQMS